MSTTARDSARAGSAPTYLEISWATRLARKFTTRVRPISRTARRAACCTAITTGMKFSRAGVESWPRSSWLSSAMNLARAASSSRTPGASSPPRAGPPCRAPAGPDSNSAAASPSSSSDSCSSVSIRAATVMSNSHCSASTSATGMGAPSPERAAGPTAAAASPISALTPSRRRASVAAIGRRLAGSQPIAERSTR